MDTLVIARHGEYAIQSGSLDERGEKQMQSLANRLSQLPGTKCILSSTAPRAVGSAKIMAEVLGTAFEQHEVLWSDGSHPTNKKAALELIQSRADSAQVIIVITHMEYCERFPAYFGNEVLQTPIPILDIGKGRAITIDCQAKSIRLA